MRQRTTGEKKEKKKPQNHSFSSCKYHVFSILSRAELAAIKKQEHKNGAKHRTNVT